MPLRTTTSSTGGSSATLAALAAKSIGGFSLALSQSATDKNASLEQTNKNQMQEEENKDGGNN